MYKLLQSATRKMAEVLISALKRRGYSVVGRPGDSDKLIHVQVGPFATKAAGRRHAPEGCLAMGITPS